MLLISLINSQYVIDTSVVADFHFQSKTPNFISRPNPTIKINENAKISHNNNFEPDRTNTDHGNLNAI